MNGLTKTASAHKQMILAIANQKGGVGKTTTAVTLAAALGRMGKRVILMDLDPHACASVHVRCYPEHCLHSIYDIFLYTGTDYCSVWKQAIINDETLPFHVVPASIRLSELEADLQERPNKGAILFSALPQLPSEYDFVILDCPPHVGVLLVNALVASNLLVIPIQTDFLALHGLKLLFDTIKTINKALPSDICYRVLPTLYDKRAKACAQVLQLLELKMPDKMFRTIIGMDTRFRDASAQGKVIYEIAPSSRGAKEYEALAREILAL